MKYKIAYERKYLAMRNFIIQKGEILGHWFGLTPSAHFREHLLSALGGLIALTCVLFISEWQLGLSNSAAIVAAIGASAVLVFNAPHGHFSQPWPVLGGHLLSAIIGVSCAQVISNPLLAVPIAIAMAILGMNVLRCVHPPGGATALNAIIAGDAVHQLGYYYVITPVLLNVVIVIIIGILFNYPFAARRYPLALRKAA